MSTTLTDQHKEEIIKWMNRPNAVFNLLFKATEDGCSGQIFHNKCDNKASTVTVAYNTLGYIFGGYTTQNWTGGEGQYVHDSNAFLFRLCDQNGEWNPIMYPIKKSEKATFCKDGYGPTFGGHDIQFFSETINATGNYYQSNGSVEYFGNIYDAQGHDVNALCGTNIQYKDIEVYQVTDGPKEPIVPLPDDQPWRKSLGWDAKVLERVKCFVANYVPLKKEMKERQARILMVGPIGAGKSSFFNTINSVFRGHVTSQAWTGSAGHSVTTKYRVYEVRNERNGMPLTFRLCDTMGIEEGHGIDEADLPYLMDGHVPDGYQFSSVTSATPEAAGYIANPNLSQRIHCIAVVLDACNLGVMPKRTMEKIEKVKKHAMSRNMPLVILLTKVDKCCPLVAVDLTKIYHSKTILNVVNKVSEIVGIPKSHVFPVKNYESELELDTPTDILALTTMQQILRFSDNYFDNCMSHMARENLEKMNINSPE